MGLITGKIAALAIAGTVAVGVTFTGTGTIDAVKSQLGNLGNKISQYEASENNLLGKITGLKVSANEKIGQANKTIFEQAQQIESLTNKNNDLNALVKKYEGEIKNLKAELANLKAANSSQFKIILAMEAELNKVKAELKATKQELAQVKDALKIVQAAHGQAVADLAHLQAKYDALTKELENEKADNASNKAESERANGEVQKANEAVEGLGVKSSEVEGATNGLNPMTQEEVDAIDTKIEDVKVPNSPKAVSEVTE